ncbi:MAG: phospho-N-acetylmuramoyl-pentapeptide-transferase [Candidatus Pacebacteria bacterium]|nr:phospho-N-acetylmuramoyl-pentapeptide-transferase [Candidatus Paceibacterota bacterium]
MIIDLIKIFVIGSASFFLAFFLTPALTYFLYKYKLWKKTSKLKSIDGYDLEVFPKFHAQKETKVPRIGGILIWFSVLFLSYFFYFLSKTGIWSLEKMNFLNRSQTWLPLFALVAAALVGLTDDVLEILSKKVIGLKLRYRILLVALIGLIGSWWFFYKLGFQTIHIPGNGDIFIGFWYIPLFILVMIATYSGSVIDGLDGLSGGAFASMFAAFGAIALARGQIDLAAFCIAITGAILAFLWFNIPPARFYMGETGIMGLCCSLTVIAFLTDSVLVLPIIGFLLVIESGSVIIQLISKKLGKKVFLAAPLHHHFEAKLWPHYKITMRFWIIGVIAALVGVAIRLLG